MVKRLNNYIKKLIFNNENSIDIKQNDIVVFVGPNNAGKSQTLKDLCALCGKQIQSKIVNPIVLKDIKIQKDSTALTKYLDEFNFKFIQKESYRNYRVSSQKEIVINDNSDRQYFENDYYGDYLSFFVANLSTDERLKISNPPEAINQDEREYHPIHYLISNAKYKKWISDNFYKAFGLHLTPNVFFGREVPLSIGEDVLTESKSMNENIEIYAKTLSSYPRIHNQGDGMRSFVGIMLYLMIENYNTYLIDEPETFLHAPQAIIMGRMIGEKLEDNQQAFISTHSEEIIKGLLDVCPNRVKIIRITRTENENDISILENDQIIEIWNDPLLKYSNILSSLFCKNVVLCESDSDCRFYSMINDDMKEKEGKYSETLFIQCGGKYKIPKILSALKSLDIDVKTIVDIDLLDDRTLVKNICESVSLEWKEIEASFDNFTNGLCTNDEKMERKIVKEIINQILDSKDDRYLENSEIEKIKDSVKLNDAYRQLKKNGREILTGSNVEKDFDSIVDILKKNSIYIVEKGELENFVKDVGNHSNKWIDNVLKKYTDFSDGVFDEAKEFIKSLNI